jgi:hypothetical protein
MGDMVVLAVVGRKGPQLVDEARPKKGTGRQQTVTCLPRVCTGPAD